MWRTVIGRLRAVGLVEGVSFLALLFVAMPLKYLAGKPEAVRVIGMAHGVLFVAFCLALLHVRLAHRWSVPRLMKVFVAALVPFGPFVIDRSLKEAEEAATNPDGSAGQA